MSKTTKTTKHEKPELPYTHKLQEPFKFGTEIHTEIVLDHELVGGDIFEVMNEKGQGDQTLRLLSIMTGWEDPKVKALPVVEVLALGEIAGRFLPSGLPTGN